MRSVMAVLAVLLFAVAARAEDAPQAAAPKPSPEQLRFFESKVRPLLVENCLKCHGPDKQKGGLRVDAISTLLVGGESGPAVVPGKPDESLLIEAVNYESFEMPPTGKLKDEQIAVLTEWVKLGAPWPDEAPVRVVEKGPKITDEDRAWWAYQPVARVAVPKVDDGGWSKNEIDPLHLRASRRRRPHARRRGRSDRAVAPRVLRSARRAAHGGRNRSVPGRHRRPTPTSG